MSASATTIQTIMKAGWEAYEKSHALPAYVRNAVTALLSCRTSELGGHIQGCPDGHFARHWYNSCKHRLCPQCAYILVERWLLKQKARLLGTDHHHIIFTIPHKLNEIWLLNVKVMTDLLFKAVRDTLFDFIVDKNHVGGLPGIILSLHTWSQTVILHNHIHCLVTAGGLGDNGCWCAPKRDTLLPYTAVMIKFRGKLLDYIDKAIVKGEIQLPATMSQQKWCNLKNKLGRKVKWNVNFRERYKHGAGVVTYLARYLRGGPIGNHRIVSCENGEVQFSYRVNGKKSKKKDLMTLPISQFIQRYLLHVPVPRSKNVRYYGLYAPNKKKELNKCRKIFGQLPVDETEFLSWLEYCENQGEEHPELCPECGKKLVRLNGIPAQRNMKQVQERRIRKFELKFPSVSGKAIFCGAQSY
ncbi:transposase [bacterium]|nr:transposase [bacterium]